MKNWRPITLLCADYEIVAKAIANRLLGVIAKVTHSDQTCGVPGRNSLESVRLLKDVVFHANQNRKAAAIISLDHLFRVFIPCIADYEFWSILPEIGFFIIFKYIFLYPDQW
jgi:hypothetical protein